MTPATNRIAEVNFLKIRGDWFGLLHRFSTQPFGDWVARDKTLDQFGEHNIFALKHDYVIDYGKHNLNK